MIRPMSSSPHRSRPLARLGPVRLALVALALLLIGLAWWGVLAGARGLESRRLSGANGEPLRFLAPQGATNAPAVIIAHGFSGSTPFMLGFAQPLARAGYGVMLLDFDGHGAARARLDDGSLQRNLDAAYAALLAQPEIDPARVALLGHSMGSGAVMSAAIADAGRYRATVAVSPTGATVSPESPRNLLLMAGTLEPQFAANGRDLLARAGGANDDLAGGRGRGDGRRAQRRAHHHPLQPDSPPGGARLAEPDVWPARGDGRARPACCLVRGPFGRLVAAAGGRGPAHPGRRAGGHLAAAGRGRGWACRWGRWPPSGCWPCSAR